MAGLLPNKPKAKARAERAPNARGYIGGGPAPWFDTGSAQVRHGFGTKENGARRPRCLDILST